VVTVGFTVAALALAVILTVATLAVPVMLAIAVGALCTGRNVAEEFRNARR
jgi:hypothetical protein